MSDLVTRAERGKFIGYAGMGVTLGPAIGPVAGGLIAHRWGWRAIFWFLTALSGVLFSIVFVFLPETGRSVVGNGSVPCPWWNVSLVGSFRKKTTADADTIKPAKRRPNPIASLRILAQGGPAVVLGFGSLMYGGYFAIMTTLPNQLSTRFAFNSVQIGLCFLPIAVGSITTRWTVGYVIDRNFRRHAAKAGYEFSIDRQQDMAKLNVERARLEVSLPMIYFACAALIAYGWVLESRSSLAAIEVCLFFCGFFFTGALNAFNVLVVDMNPTEPATASAANNLFRCLVGAGATAVATPLIAKIGMGWLGVFIAGLWIVFSPAIWAMMLWGNKWRMSKQAPEQV